MAGSIKTIKVGSNRISNTIANYKNTKTNLINQYNKDLQTELDWNTAWQVIAGVGQAAAGIGSLTQGFDLGITKGVGYALEGLGSIGSAIQQNKISKLETKISNTEDAYDAFMSDYSEYGTALENRDAVLQQYSDAIQSTLTTFNNTYGSNFTNAVKNLFYSINGLDSSTISILNKNFSTFNDIGEGTISGFTARDGYDESNLTTDVNNYFNNEYTELEMSDLNQKLTNQFYNLLVNADTSFASSVKGYETELKTYISESLASERSTLDDYRSQLEEMNIENKETDLSNLYAVANAKYRESTSGIRGANGSSTKAQLARDMSNAKQAISLQAYITKIRNYISNSEMQIRNQVLEYRQTEQNKLKEATETALNAWNSKVVSYAKTGESQANEYLYNASLLTDTLEEDIDTISGLVG